jgi:hypothetical protein
MVLNKERVNVYKLVQGWLTNWLKSNTFAAASQKKFNKWSSETIKKTERDRKAKK